MKKILFVLALNNLVSLAFASSDACVGYANNSETILDRISLSKSRDLRVIEIALNQELAICTDQNCLQEAKDKYLNRSFNVLEKEKNAILDAYKNLTNHCKN